VKSLERLQQRIILSQTTSPLHHFVIVTNDFPYIAHWTGAVSRITGIVVSSQTTVGRGRAGTEGRAPIIRSTTWYGACVRSLNQLCPTRGPVEGFVRPSLGVRCRKNILHTDNLSLLS